MNNRLSQHFAEFRQGRAPPAQEKARTTGEASKLWLSIKGPKEDEDTIRNLYRELVAASNGVLPAAYVLEIGEDGKELTLSCLVTLT